MAEPDQRDLPTEPSPPEPPPARVSGNSWQPPTAEELQRSFPQYEIRGVLGRGGMGAVYKGWQKSLDRFVAIKILPPEIEQADPNFGERFKREAKAMARFTHPAIISVFDAGETPERLLYYVMEYIEGTDVQKMVKQGPLPPEYALAITAHVCDALAYAHERGVIHRDIKPSNVIIDRDGRVMVADFGLAKVTGDGAEEPLTGDRIMGTLHFMAPETMEGAGKVDQRADLYAVGVMLYQMLTGEIPRGRFETPSNRRPDLDPRFDEIVEHAMQSNPDQRYANATEIRTHLEEIASEPARPAELAAAAEEVEGGGGTVVFDQSGESPHSTPGLPARVTAQRKIRGLFVLLATAIGAGALLGYILHRTQTEFVLEPSTEETGSATVADASKEHPFINGLGMRFVPVPVPGESRVLFSIWETRVRDYKIFAAQMPRRRWNVGFAQTLSNPVVNVTWDDAEAFCDWLTNIDHNLGRLSPSERYRLPTDNEWSCAVGIGESEDPVKTPMSKSRQVQGYPWGSAWPPPPGAGNYLGEEARDNEPLHNLQVLVGYRDGFTRTAPVGSFAPNRFGLFDLGGNAAEWCAAGGPVGSLRFTRGASWSDSDRGALLSSDRNHRSSGKHGSDIGFRVVIASDAAQR